VFQGNILGEVFPPSNGGRVVQTFVVYSPLQLCAASRGKRSFDVPEVLSRALPGELWGAFNVVSGIAKSYVSQATKIRSQVGAIRSQNGSAPAHVLVGRY